MNNAKRQEVERKVVRHLIRTMKKHGWAIHSVNDGEETVKAKTETEAMDTVFSVDECWMRFQKDGKRHSVYIVLGNDGWDAIADHSFAEGDPDGFKAIMDGEIDDYADKLAEEC